MRAATVGEKCPVQNMKLTIFFTIVCLSGLAASASVGGSRGCDRICLEIYRPVCGVEVQADGTSEKRTFSNSCFMELENACHGRNFVACPKSCDRFCLDVYRPVCGVEVRADGTSEQRTFSNSCYMKRENECKGRKFVACSKKEENKE